MTKSKESLYIPIRLIPAGLIDEDYMRMPSWPAYKSSFALYTIAFYRGAHWIGGGCAVIKKWFCSCNVYALRRRSQAALAAKSLGMEVFYFVVLLSMQSCKWSTLLVLASLRLDTMPLRGTSLWDLSTTSTNTCNVFFRQIKSQVCFCELLSGRVVQSCVFF